MKKVKRSKSKLEQSLGKFDVEGARARIGNLKYLTRYLQDHLASIANNVGLIEEYLNNVYDAIEIGEKVVARNKQKSRRRQVRD